MSISLVASDSIRYSAMRVVQPIAILFGDEGEAGWLRLVGQMGGHPAEAYLNDRVAHLVRSHGNDILLSGAIDGLISVGHPLNACNFATILSELDIQEDVLYVFILLAHGLQELGQAPLQVIVPGGLPYERFCISNFCRSPEQLANGRRRLEKLIHSFWEWWENGGHMKLRDGRELQCGPGRQA